MAFRAPRTEMEITIADIVKEVLAVDRVGVDDNFFDLGGNSSLLARVHKRLEEAIGREIQAVELFNHPKVSALASYLSGPQGSAAALPAAVPVDRSQELKRGQNRLQQRLSRRRHPAAKR